MKKIKLKQKFIKTFYQIFFIKHKKQLSLNISLSITGSHKKLVQMKSYIDDRSNTDLYYNIRMLPGQISSRYILFSQILNNEVTNQ